MRLPVIGFEKLNANKGTAEIGNDAPKVSRPQQLPDYASVMPHSSVFESRFGVISVRHSEPTPPLFTVIKLWGGFLSRPYSWVGAS